MRILLLIAVLAVSPLSAVFAQPAAVGPTKVRTVIRSSKASILLECGDKSYTLSSGSKTGKCEVYHSPDGGTYGACVDGAKGAAFANCAKGCTSTRDAGSCGKG